MAHEISTFLSLLSDETFLSSIEYIDFRHRFVSVRRSYFNLLFKDITVTNPRGFATMIKSQYLSRFSEVSANKLKSYFLGLIRNSFLDFVNVHRYFSEVILSHLDSKGKKLNRRNNLRSHRYFERKAFKYYVFQKYRDDNNSESNSLVSVEDTISRDDDFTSNEGDNVFSEQFGSNSIEPRFDVSETQRILNEIQPYTEQRVLVSDLENTYIPNLELDDTITIRTYRDSNSNILRQELREVSVGHEIDYPNISGETIYRSFPTAFQNDDSD